MNTQLLADSARSPTSNYNLFTQLSLPARKLESLYAVWFGSMKDLVGTCFSVADGRYRIVDVRQMGGDAMVYAEPVPAENAAASDAQDEGAGSARPAAPNRAAFHYADIASILDVPRSA